MSKATGIPLKCPGNLVWTKFKYFNSSLGHKNIPYYVPYPILFLVTLPCLLPSY